MPTLDDTVDTITEMQVILVGFLPMKVDVRTLLTCIDRASMIHRTNLRAVWPNFANTLHRVGASLMGSADRGEQHKSRSKESLGNTPSMNA